MIPEFDVYAVEAFLKFHLHIGLDTDPVDADTVRSKISGRSQLDSRSVGIDRDHRLYDALSEALSADYGCFAVILERT